MTSLKRSAALESDLFASGWYFLACDKYAFFRSAALALFETPSTGKQHMKKRQEVLMRREKSKQSLTWTTRDAPNCNRSECLDANYRTNSLPYSGTNSRNYKFLRFIYLYNSLFWQHAQCCYYETTCACNVREQMIARSMFHTALLAALSIGDFAVAKQWLALFAEQHGAHEQTCHCLSFQQPSSKVPTVKIYR